MLLFIKRKLVLMSALLGSYLVVTIVSPLIFINNTESIRPNVGQYIASKITSFIEENNPMIAQKTIEQQKELKQKAEVALKNLETTPFSVVTKGVYAKSNEMASVREYVLNEIEWVEYTFDVKGKKIIIKVPKGESAPPLGLAEKMAE